MKPFRKALPAFTNNSDVLYYDSMVVYDSENAPCESLEMGSGTYTYPQLKRSENSKLSRYLIYRLQLPL